MELNGEKLRNINATMVAILICFKPQLNVPIMGAGIMLEHNVQNWNFTDILKESFGHTN